LPCTIILTKADKLKQNDKPKNKKMIKEALNLREEDRMIQTSVLKKEGIQETLNVIEEVLKDYEPIVYEEEIEE
jgi:GTP-binding protein